MFARFVHEPLKPIGNNIIFRITSCTINRALIDNRIVYLLKRQPCINMYIIIITTCDNLSYMLFVNYKLFSQYIRGCAFNIIHSYSTRLLWKRTRRDGWTIHEVGGLTRGVGGHAPLETFSKLISLKWLKTLLNFINHSENKNSDYINRKKLNSKYYRN